jgi:hypothetical protein
VPDAEKRTFTTSPDLENVQGRAPSSRPHVRKYVTVGEETLVPPSGRKLM